MKVADVTKMFDYNLTICIKYVIIPLYANTKIKN